MTIEFVIDLGPVFNLFSLLSYLIPVKIGVTVNTSTNDGSS